MPHPVIRRLSTLALTLLFAGGANANPLDLDISFTVSGVPGNYLYDFTIRNDSLDPIDVYSLAVNEADLTVASSPSGWAQAFFAPVQWCSAGGDCFDNTGGIQPGESLSGFTASSTSSAPLSEASWTVAIVGPTVATLGLPNTAGDTATFSGMAFEQGATGKYRFEIVSPPGAVSTQAFGINDAGQVVGNANDGTAGFSYIYDLEDCAYTNLGTAISPLEINNAGVMVGTTDDEQCAIRDVFGVVSFLQPPMAVFCEARGVNSGGQVSGLSVDDSGVWQGFIYNPQNQTFEQFLPSTQTFAAGLNDAGDVAGSVFLLADAAFPGSVEGRYAYLRKADGSVKYFSIAQASPGQSRARGRSNSGLVSGWYSDAVTQEFRSYATTLSDGTAFEEITLSDSEIIYQKPCDPNLPPPPTPDYELITDVFASQIRDDGVVVGSCIDTYFDGSTGDAVSHNVGFVASPIGSDVDDDGIADDFDNCIAVANPDQADFNGDNIGDLCDADVTGPGGDNAEDCFVNFLDLQRVKDAFFASPASPSWDPEVDFDGSDLINFTDLQIVKNQIFGPPGPSAAGCN